MIVMTGGAMEKISIVIPTYNEDRYLPACVDRCLFQTYPELEIIIVDGGSTDGTKQYLQGLRREIKTRTVSPVLEMDDGGEIVRKPVKACPQDRDLVIVSFDENIGATATINEGLARVTGRYCTYVVGDDLPHPHMIEDLARVLDETGADFAYSDLDVVDDHGRIIRRCSYPGYDFNECFAKWYRLGVSRLYRASLHERVGLMDEAYKAANDYDHHLRFAMAGARFFHLPRVLYSVRHHGEDRRVGQHAPGNYSRLIEESKKCAARARRFQETGSCPAGLQSQAG